MARAAPALPSFPTTGSGHWQYAAGTGSEIGTSGAAKRFRVAVETDIAGIAPDEFAAEVTAALGGSGGWATGGQFRMRLVGANERADFTIYLATPGTRDALCHDGPDLYTSCQDRDKVVINVRRWVRSVPDYGAPLATYRRYAINHETGHYLGYHHQLCPGPGRPAPIMLQQTLGLHGCTANASPYLDGALYTGPTGAYSDPIPHEPD